MRYCILLCMALSQLTFAQTKSIQNSPPLSESSPRSVGMSEERLSFIDDVLIESIEKNEIPGAVALVARKGKIVYYKAFGSADNTAKRNQTFMCKFTTNAPA